MTLLDLFKLIRHYLKLVIALPLICALASAIAIIITPPTYTAKATLLTNGDVALAGGYAQTEASIYSQNGITVNAAIDTSRRTIAITSEGSDYGGCIAAVNATVIAAAEDCRNANSQVMISANEATSAESMTPNIAKSVTLALLAGLFAAICIVVVIDMVKAPIKSENDIKIAANLPVIGRIPNLDRGERLLANVRFLSENPPSTIAIIPVGSMGGALTSTELASAFENAGVPVMRVQGSPHAEGFNHAALPGLVTIVECAPLFQGMGAAYVAREADVTILCACEWSDSRKALSTVVEELRLAQVNPTGVVFLTRYYPK